MNQVELNKIYEGFFLFTSKQDVFIVTSQKRQTESFLKRVESELETRGINVRLCRPNCYTMYKLQAATYEAKMSERWGLYHSIWGTIYTFGAGDIETNKHCEVIFLD